VADEGLADRRLVADAAFGRRGFGRADDDVLIALAVLLDRDVAADLDDLVVLVLVDDRRVLDHLLEGEDATLEEGLIVLRLLELGVLRVVAELHGRVDTLRDLLPLVVAQLLELGLELLQSVRRDRDRFVRAHRRCLRNASRSGKKEH